MEIVIAALIASIAPILTVIITSRKSAKKVEQIHVLVNSRLSEALAEIASLKERNEEKDQVILDQDKDRN